jgi:MFS family permease
MSVDKPKHKKDSAAMLITTSKFKMPGQLGILYGLGVLLAVSSALPAYVQSNFLGEFISIQSIGYLLIIANATSLVSILLFPGIIKTLTNQLTTKIVLAVYGLSLLGLATANHSLLAISSVIIFIVSSNLIWINMDILIESLSKNTSTGRTRTIYFTFINAGWIFSPLVSSYFITKGGYSLVFLAAAILILPILVVFNQQSHHAQPDIKYDRKALWPVIVRMCKDKNRRSIFIISMLLQLFYSSAVIYIPFYLLNTLGMDYKVLGPIFSLMLLPFLIIEIPAGIMADKYWGEKEMLIAGLLIISGSLFFFYYINTPTVWLWALVLFFSRIGAALVEAMRESYFFKIVDAKDLIDINLFRTAGPMGYIVASALAIIILRFFPLNYLFLFLSIVMLAGLTFAMTLRDTK